MNGKFRFGLRAKFVLIIVLILVGIFVAFSYALVSFNIRNLTNAVNQETILFTELASNPIGDTFKEFQFGGTIRISQTIQRYANLNPNVTNFSIIDTAGEVLFSQIPDAGVSVPPENARSFVPIYNKNSSGNITQAIIPYFEDSGVRRYSVVYDVSDDAIGQSVDRQLSIIATFIIAGMIASIIIMYSLVEINFIRPIRSLSQQALAISAGNIHQTIQTDRSDEVMDLTLAVNTMAASLRDDIKKLEQLDEMKSEFLTIVSHNMRTPLTIINGYLDNAEGANTVEELREIIKNLQEGGRRLSSFAEDMITIAKLESGQAIGNRTIIEAVPFMESIANDFAELADSKEVKFTRQLETGDYSLMINKTLIRGAINGLLDNALKFTQKDGAIHLKVTKDDNSVYISVQDTGIGISDEAKRNLFTKFHRGTSVLTYDYEGTGIGLYSAKLVVKQHGGNISFDSMLGQGSTFTITLPLALTEQA